MVITDEYLKRMTTTAKHDEQMANMVFAKVYPMYIAKVEKKGRTKQELDRVIEWLTGYGENELQRYIASNATFGELFGQARIHPNAHLITGVICGYRVEEITNETTRKIRYLDKLVDELAKGRKMEKILREG